MVSALGGSSVQIGGPTGAFIVIVLGIITEYGMSGLLVATLMAGILLVLMGLLRLGTLIKFIPYPIILGFTAGIAVTIFTTSSASASRACLRSSSPSGASCSRASGRRTG